MPLCKVCGREKTAKQYDDLTPFKKVSELAEPPKTLQERNERFGEGDYLYCVHSECPSAVFCCFSCQDLLPEASVRCDEHDVCEFDTDIGACGSPNSTFNFCSLCGKLYRRCHQRKHAVGRCLACGAHTKGGFDLLEALTSYEVPISIPIPPPDVSSCSGSDLSDFSEAAVYYAGLLADWLQSNGPHYDVDVGHLTLCVTILEKDTLEGRPKVKVLLTHSSSYTYEKNPTKKDTIRVKVTGDKPDRYELADGLGLRRLARGFMEQNRKAIGGFLAKYDRTNAKNSIMLPRSEPMVFYDRETKSHYLLVPDTDDEIDAQAEAAVGNGALERAVQFARGHGYRLYTGESEELGAYELEANNSHHAEMRAIRYAEAYGYRVVAMAPTKGCCTKAQRAHNCNAALAKLDLLERVPEERRTQDGYNEVLKSGERGLDLVDYEDIQLLLVIQASLEEPKKHGEMVTALEEDFEVEDVDPDGNCLFAAISTAIHQHEHNALTYRQEAVDYAYAHFTLAQIRAGSENWATREQYRTVMRVPATSGADIRRYGGHVEMAALSLGNGFEFRIYSADRGADNPLVIPDGGQLAPAAVVHLYYVNRNHYMALIPR